MIFLVIGRIQANLSIYKIEIGLCNASDFGG